MTVLSLISVEDYCRVMLRGGLCEVRHFAAERCGAEYMPWWLDQVIERAYASGMAVGAAGVPSALRGYLLEPANDS